MKSTKKAALLIILPLITFTVNGQTLEELKSEYSGLIDEQEATRTMLEKNYSIQDEIREQIAELDTRLSEAQIDIDNIDSKMMELLIKIDEAQKDYDEAAKKSEQQYKKASDRLRYIYESGGKESDLDVLLNCENISEYFLYKQYVTDILEYDSQLMEELKKTEELMKSKLDEITESQEAKSALENFRTQKEFEMTVLYEERNELLEEYRQDASLMEQELNESIEASNRVYEIIISMEENSDFVNAYTGGFLEWPVEGRYYVSSGYVGRMSPVGNGYEFHTGLDIPAPSGYEITAAEDGVVITAGWINGYGNTVIISHGGGLSTLYGHNSELLVSEGDKVERGEPIALCGSTGYATGCHCHFEVRVNGEHTDPWGYLKREQ